jgi:alpha-amylase
MKYMRCHVVTIVALTFLIGCTSSKNSAGKPEKAQTAAQKSNGGAATGHPEWAAQSNIYEVNLRQYTKEGSIRAFEASLPRLRKMGVEILWFMPITPISVTDRKGSLGSYYAVADYRAINPEFGTMDDWKKMVRNAHKLGFKVITDWVPNHTGGDHKWLKTHPDFFVRNEKGEVVAPFDWTDVRKLDYKNSAMRDSMIASMRFWIEETGIDGFRCDVAGEVPTDFWKQCIDELRKTKHVFMLAEADQPDMHTAGFDATYTWSVFSILNDIAAGKKTISSLDSAVASNESRFPNDAYRMYFTCNHDENSWNGTEFEKMGDGALTFAVFTQTMHRSIPLIYSGQEEPNKKRLLFFEKDPISWGKYALSDFYKTLLTLRSENPALAADASFKKLSTNNNEAVYAFVREKNSYKIIVVLNLTNKAQQVMINDYTIEGSPLEVFTKENIQLKKDKAIPLDPWGYKVYQYYVR